MSGGGGGGGGQQQTYLTHPTVSELNITYVYLRVCTLRGAYPTSLQCVALLVSGRDLFNSLAIEKDKRGSNKPLTEVILRTP